MSQKRLIITGKVTEEQTAKIARQYLKHGRRGHVFIPPGVTVTFINPNQPPTAEDYINSVLYDDADNDSIDY